MERKRKQRSTQRMAKAREVKETYDDIVISKITRGSEWLFCCRSTKCLANMHQAVRGRENMKRQKCFPVDPDLSG
jgi:hypothetical protein